MSKFPISTALGLIIVFCVSFAIMWRQREAAQWRVSTLDAGSNQPMALEPGSSVAANPPLVAVMPTRARAQSPVAASVPNPEPAPRPPFQRSEDTEPQPLPVAFHIRKLGEPATTEGDIRNATRAPLSVTIREIDANKQPVAQTQLELAPGQRKTFGTDDGLVLRTGDQLILESPSYQDKVAWIP